MFGWVSRGLPPGWLLTGGRGISGYARAPILVMTRRRGGELVTAEWGIEEGLDGESHGWGGGLARGRRVGCGNAGAAGERGFGWAGDPRAVGVAGESEAGGRFQDAVRGAVPDRLAGMFRLRAWGGLGVGRQAVEAGDAWAGCCRVYAAMIRRMVDGAVEA